MTSPRCFRCKRFHPRLAWWAGLLVAGWMTTVSAQVALESVSNTTLAGSGPAGNGPSVADQVITLRHNTNNPSGNTMVARTPAITVTYRLTNQQFTGLTSAELYVAGTGGNGVFFGALPTNHGAGGPSSAPLYSTLTIGAGTPAMYTSVGAMAGQGIDVSANAGIQLATTSNAITHLAPSTPTTARVRMADLVLTFSVPVTNPVLHFSGMGSKTSSRVGSTVQLGLTTEFDMVTPGATFTRLSGTGNFVVSATQITNSAINPGATCNDGVGACGSVRVNGVALSALTLRVYLRGDGAIDTWSGEPGSFNMDASLVSVSLNEPPATVTVRKITQGGTGTFNFSGDNGFAVDGVTTTVAGAPATGTTRTLSAVNTATTITEFTSSAYRLTDITCSGLGNGGTATPTYNNSLTIGGSVALNAAATAPGSNIQCTFTNDKVPVIRVQKALPDGRAIGTDQFTLSITGPGAPVAVTTTGSGTTAGGVVTHGTATIGSSYTLSETAAGTPATLLSNYQSTYSCTNALVGGQTPSGSGTSFTVTPAAGDDLTCTFTNAKLPVLRVRKVLPDGRRFGSEQFRLMIIYANNIQAQATTTGSSNAPTDEARFVATPGRLYTLSEEEVAGVGLGPYYTTYACTNTRPGGQAPSGAGVSQFNLTPVLGDDLTCTFSNQLRKTDVSVQKTASVASVAAGQAVQFTLLVNNAGPMAADGAVIRDPVTPGLSCSGTVACTPAGGATCPFSSAIADLHSPGLTIPALPVGGSVSLVVSCTVTASGF